MTLEELNSNFKRGRPKKQHIDYYSLSWEEEKQVAVDMWEYIKKRIRRGSKVSIGEMKADFIKQTFLNDEENYQRFVWWNDCILCDNVSTCSTCPLAKIDLPCYEPASAYDVVCSRFSTLDDRIRACDKIIKAIKILKERVK